MDKSSRAFERGLKRIKQKVSDAFEQSVPKIVEDLKDMISEPSPPRSIPGDPPHLETGELHDSIQGKFSRDKGGVSIKISTDVEYAPYLEWGTDKMAPRPFFRRSARNAKTILDSSL